MNKVKDVLYKIFIKYQGLIVLLIAIDQITKRLAVTFLDSNDPVLIFGIPWLQLKLQWNSGVAFSFLSDAPQWISAAISIIAVIVIEFYLIKYKPKSKFLFITLMFIVSGALGNGIDRWLSVFGKYTGYKGVIDFIFPTFFANFNVADMYVTLSCIVLIIYFIFNGEHHEENKEEKAVIEQPTEENNNQEIKDNENESNQ